MKNVILADCSAEGLQSFRSGVISGGGISYEIETSISNFGRTGRFSNLRRYFKYFSFPFGVFLRRKQYKRIIGWQQFYALVFCFFCSIFRVRKQQELIVAVNFTYKKKGGFVGIIYEWFMKKAICNHYIDYIHVLSKQYAKDICEEFHVSESKMVVCPFGVIDRYEEFKDIKVKEELHLPEHYALAIGRSNRDYGFLMDSWKDMNIPLVIVCDQWDGDLSSVPSNIIWFNSISGNEQFPLIMNCDVLILALKDGSIPSGDTVLLTAMSFRKKIIVSKPSTIVEMYIKENINGITFEKSQHDLEEAVNKALRNDDLGRTARISYEQEYSQYAMGLQLAKSITGSDSI